MHGKTGMERKHPIIAMRHDGAGRTSLEQPAINGAADGARAKPDLLTAEEAQLEKAMAAYKRVPLDDSELLFKHYTADIWAASPTWIASLGVSDGHTLIWSRIDHELVYTIVERETGENIYRSLPPLEDVPRHK